MSEETQLTITADQISTMIPITVECLNEVGLIKGEKVTFFKCINRKREWYLVGRTLDKSKFLSITDKKQKFGVIENEKNN